MFGWNATRPKQAMVYMAWSHYNNILKGIFSKKENLVRFFPLKLFQIGSPEMLKLLSSYEEEPTSN